MAMNISKPNVIKKLRMLKSNFKPAPDILNEDKTMKSTQAGTIIYATLNTHNLIEFLIVSPKFNEGNIEDSFKPIWTIENRYPGTIRINKNNANNPNTKRYLLSDNHAIGTVAIKINKINRIGNFLMFLKGYLTEFEMIFPKSILTPSKTTFQIDIPSIFWYIII